MLELGKHLNCVEETDESGAEEGGAGLPLLEANHGHLQARVWVEPVLTRMWEVCW